VSVEIIARDPLRHPKPPKELPYWLLPRDVAWEARFRRALAKRELVFRVMKWELEASKVKA
jgi:hypothetical protein